MKYPNETAQAYMRRCERAHRMFGIFSVPAEFYAIDIKKLEARITAHFLIGDIDGDAKQDTADEKQTWISNPS